MALLFGFYMTLVSLVYFVMRMVDNNIRLRLLCEICSDIKYSFEILPILLLKLLYA